MSTKDFLLNFAALAAAVPLHAQTGLAARPAFEVASIKMNDTTGRRSVDFSPDTLTIQNLPLANILIQAYLLPFERMSFGSFDSVFRQRYDIVAKAPGRVSREQMRLMLQTLLATRFHLAVHYDQKLEQVYALVVEKGGPKLQAAAKPDVEGDFDKRLGPSVPVQTIKFTNATMELVAGIVMEQANTSKTDGLPPPIVVDLTGLKGGYDFTLEWRRDEEPSDSAAPSGMLQSLIGALHKFGLTLKSQKAPVDILVVDHVDKAPSEN